MHSSFRTTEEPPQESCTSAIYLWYFMGIQVKERKKEHKKEKRKKRLPKEKRKLIEERREKREDRR